jgi:hypothetical protein
MPNPTVQAVHIDKALSTLTLAQIQSGEGFVAGDVFPIIPVEKKTDKYYTFERNVFARDDVRRRAPGDKVARIGYQLSTDSYLCENEAIGTEIFDQVRDNTDVALDLEQGAATLLASQWRQHFERLWTSEFFAAGIYGSGAVGGLGVGTELTGVGAGPGAGQFLQWSDPASDPVKDIRAAIRTFQIQSGGIKPNRLVLSARVHDALVDHPDIVDRIKYTEDALVDPAMILTGMARLFQIERIVVAEAVKATNAEGAAEAYDFIQGKHALLAYRPARPSLMTPMTGAIFVWRDFNNTGMTVPVKRLRDDFTASDVLESEAAFDIKITSKSLGLFFASAVA